MANVNLHDPLVEKLLAAVQGEEAKDVERASLRFHQIVTMYTPRTLGIKTPFRVEITTD